MKVIAVDFDGTLCRNSWPDIGEPFQDVINQCIERQANGDKIVLWTCRSGALLDAAVMWCLNHGLKFDAINDNLPENIEKYGNNCRKIWADEYWDDKNVLVMADGIGYYGTIRTAPIPMVSAPSIPTIRATVRKKRTLLQRLYWRMFH